MDMGEANPDGDKGDKSDVGGDKAACDDETPGENLFYRKRVFSDHFFISSRRLERKST